MTVNKSLMKTSKNALKNVSILNNNNTSRTEKITHCTVILKSGVNKGKICNRINCKYHTPVISACTEILKSGPRKGEVCNRINCKYHSKINLLSIVV